MKKKQRKIAIIIICFFVLNISIPILAASGSAKVFYRTTQGNPTGIYISNWLSSMGYSTSSTTNASPSTVLSNLRSNKVVHIICHGNIGHLVLEGGNLTTTTLASNTFNNLKFVYAQACYSAATDSSGYSVINTIYNNGATSAMGFTGEVFGGQSTGVHQYSVYFYQQIYNNNYTIQQAASVARNQIYAEYGNSYGVDSRYILGGSTKIK